MQWTKEVQIAKCIDELMTLQSIVGRKDFSDYDMLDAMIASALKKLITNMHFRRRVSTEELRAQNETRFLRGRQIAFMIYEHFRATGAYDASQGLSDLFNVRLQDDDVQNFNTRWAQALLSASEVPSEMVPEGLYMSKLQDSVQLQTTWAMYEQEIIRNNEQPNYSRLKIAIGRHIHQQLRTRNFRAQNEIVERGAVTKRPKGRKAVVESVQEETLVASVMSKHPGTDAARDKKNKRSLPHQKRGHRLTKSFPPKSLGHRGGNPSGTRGRFSCLDLFKGKCTNSSCNYWHPPVCINYKSETGCVNGKKVPIPTC